MVVLTSNGRKNKMSDEAGGVATRRDVLVISYASVDTGYGEQRQG